MIETFRSRFGAGGQVRIFRAPGRVNLIGEHTDYNLGFVLPVALDLACYVAAAPSGDGKLRIYSEHRDEVREWTAGQVREAAPQRHWTDYSIGVAQELIRAGFPVEPKNLYIRSTVPEGSGLSSSAALEVSSALALLGGRQLERLELAKLCQRAERNFVGMPCGIMDQYISIFGREHAAVRIDCRSLAHEIVPLPNGITFLAVNTMVKHELASSAYKERTQECAAAVDLLRRKFPFVESLRDATSEMLAQVEMPPVIARRARHVVTEDERVTAFVDAASAGDLARMGQLFGESHASLRDDYEVSSQELDFLVDTAGKIDGVYGARMTGGGFGGCMVAMLKPKAAGQFEQNMRGAYRERFGVDPQVYACRPSSGAAEIADPSTVPGPA